MSYLILLHWWVGLVVGALLLLCSETSSYLDFFQSIVTVAAFIASGRLRFFLLLVAGKCPIIRRCASSHILFKLSTVFDESKTAHKVRPASSFSINCFIVPYTAFAFPKYAFAAGLENCRAGLLTEDSGGIGRLLVPDCVVNLLYTPDKFKLGDSEYPNGNLRRRDCGSFFFDFASVCVHG